MQSQEIQSVQIIRSEKKSFLGIKYTLELVGRKGLGKPLVESEMDAVNPEQWWNLMPDKSNEKMFDDLSSGSLMRKTTARFGTVTMQRKYDHAQMLAVADIRALLGGVIRTRIFYFISQILITAKYFFVLLPKMIRYRLTFKK